MKKNVMMRAASALLVAVLLTTCAISGTFAKYTTSATGTDKARVAKWGFEAAGSVEITDLFDYSDPGVHNNGQVTGLIAPGTTNSKSFAFTYDKDSNGVSAPEVDYTFNVSTEGSSCNDAIKNNSNIKWYLDGALAPAYKGNGTDADPQYKEGTWDALLMAIEALDGNQADDKYESNTLPEAFYGTTPNGAAEHTVKWEWVFETAGAGMADQDKADTAMGNADILDTVELKITITATQVD